MIPGLDIILGGVTGLVGNLLTTWFKYKNAKLEYAHEQKMIALQTQATIQKAQMQIAITKAKIAGEIEVADSAAYKTSQEVGSKKLFHEKWIDLLTQSAKEKKFGFIFTIIGTLVGAAFAFVDWVNGLMRPSLTIYLVGSSTYITMLAWKIMQTNGLNITTTQAVGIFTQVTSTMIYLAVSAVTWWFGDRTISKFLQQQGAKKDRLINVTKTSPPKTTGVTGGGDVDI